MFQETKTKSSVLLTKKKYQTNKLHMDKYILKTPLARVLVNKINYPQTKEGINYQSNRSIMRKYILETSLVSVLRIKIINSHTKEGVKSQFNKSIVGSDS